MDIDLSEYMGAYIDGSRENLDTMDRMLLNLEQNPQNLGAVEEIFRAAHTLKGMSATMGFEKVAHLTHEMENVLDKLRTKQIPVTAAVIDVIFETFDVLRTLVNDTIAQTDSGVGLEVVTEKLHSIVSGGGEASTPAADAEAVETAPAPAPESAESTAEAPSQLIADLTELALSDFETSGLVESCQNGMVPYILKVNLVSDCLLKGPRIFMVLRTLDSLHCEIAKSCPEVKDLENEKFERSFKMIVSTEHTPEEIKYGIESISEIEEAQVFQINLDALRVGDLSQAFAGGFPAESASAQELPLASEAPPPPPPPATPPPSPQPTPIQAPPQPKKSPPARPVSPPAARPMSQPPAATASAAPPSGMDRQATSGEGVPVTALETLSAEESEETPEEKIQKETIVQLVSFRMAGETYALEINQVVGIINLKPVTRVPKAPPHIAGVINLRGEIIPVINLRKKLKLPDIERVPTMQIVILAFDQEKVKVGFLVDNVSEVLRLPESAIEPPSHVSESVDIEHLKGVGKIQNKIIILLDAHKIIFG